jgi:hypothetical protein
MIKDKEINELLNEIEKRQDKSSLNKYLNEDFNFEENDNFIVF